MMQTCQHEDFYHGGFGGEFGVEPCVERAVGYFDGFLLCGTHRPRR